MDFDDVGLPMLSLNTEPQDFDYGAFLQGEDADYLTEESSAQSTSAGTLTGAGSLRGPGGQAMGLAKSTSPSTSNNSSNSSPPKRLERRGHTKSRRGCYNCKRRRIKVASRSVSLCLDDDVVF